jgi:hypothetical protein
MSMFRRLFCCCARGNRAGDDYEFLGGKGSEGFKVSQDLKASDSAALHETFHCAEGAPISHSYTHACPCVHVHVTTPETPHSTCCKRSQPPKGGPEDNKVQVPQKKPMFPLDVHHCDDATAPATMGSQLQWSMFDKDMKTDLCPLMPNCAGKVYTGSDLPCDTAH